MFFGHSAKRGWMNAFWDWARFDGNKTDRVIARDRVIR
jgi:hypothetical protein